MCGGGGGGGRGGTGGISLRLEAGGHEIAVRGWREGGHEIADPGRSYGISSWEVIRYQLLGSHEYQLLGGHKVSAPGRA